MLDPFVPIEVPAYSDAEADSVLDYFIDMQWLQSPQGMHILYIPMCIYVPMYLLAFCSVASERVALRCLVRGLWFKCLVYDIPTTRTTFPRLL